MKRSLLILLLIGSVMARCAGVLAADGLSGSITISGAWAIYPTVVAWAEAFQKKYPGVRIDVSAGGAGKGAADAIVGLADIGMVSRDPDPAELQKTSGPCTSSRMPFFPLSAKKFLSSGTFGKRH